MGIDFVVIQVDCFAIAQSFQLRAVSCKDGERWMASRAQSTTNCDEALSTARLGQEKNLLQMVSCSTQRPDGLEALVGIPAR